VDFPPRTEAAMALIGILYRVKVTQIHLLLPNILAFLVPQYSVKYFRCVA